MNNYPPGVTGREDYFYPETCACGGDMPAEDEACEDCGRVLTADGLVDADTYRELQEEKTTLSCTECGGGGVIETSPADEGQASETGDCPACEGTGRVNPCHA